MSPPVVGFIQVIVETMKMDFILYFLSFVQLTLAQCSMSVSLNDLAMFFRT